MNKTVLMTNSIIAMLVSYSIFLRSFISPKKLITSVSTHHDVLASLSSLNAVPVHSNPQNNLINLYGSLVNNTTYYCVTVVLIDALRVDFIQKEKMPFLQSLLEVNGASSFIAKVQPPTVTLPRIKALTTGSIPGFVDVVLNFGSSSLKDDNIISQMKHHGKKMVFYGDDTWLNLFPDHFIRSDGTTSFFVTDYTEVDDNVTHHLHKELEHVDFDLMVLHYLGLDHIGHLAGPFSPLIEPKLQEMDNIIEKIYLRLTKISKPSLIIVCGDHGMSDQGGHGGATYSETRVPVIFIKTGETSVEKKEKENRVAKEVEQIDLAPTLSVLLGVPFPKNNLGTAIIDVLTDYDIQQKLMVLMVNGLQLSEVLKHNIPDYNIDKGYHLYIRAYKSFVTWLNGNTSTSVSMDQGLKLMGQFEESIRMMSSRMSSSVTQYDEYGLVVSILFLWLILSVYLCMFTENDSGWFSWQMFFTVLLISVFFHLTMCTSDTCHSDILCNSSASGVFLQIYLVGTLALFASIVLQFMMNRNLSCFSAIQIIFRRRSIPLLFVVGTILHTISLLSSSFVEEEHQTWFFYVVTANVLILKSMVGQIVTLKLNVESPEKLGKFQKLSQNVNKTKLSAEGLTQNDDSEYYYKEINAQHYKGIKLDNGDSQNKCSKKSSVYSVPTWTHVVMVISVLILNRLMRSWNQTGNKWLNTPDIGDYLIRPENLYLLSILVAMCLLIVFLCKRINMSCFQQFLYFVCLLCIYLQKSANGSLVNIWDYTTKNGVTEAQIVYILQLLYILVSILCNYNPILPYSINKYRLCYHVHTVFILMILVLARPHNIILIAMMVVTETVIEKYIWRVLQLNTTDWIIYLFWLGQASFYYQGNSNSISTVDVSAGYVGLHDYQPVIVGFLLTIATYGGLIFWLLSMLKFIFWKSAKTENTTEGFRKRLKNELAQVVHILCLSRALPLAVYTVLVTFMRYHLFVWTVFSPKLLYEGMLTVVLSLTSLIIIMCNTFL